MHSQEFMMPEKFMNLIYWVCLHRSLSVVVMLLIPYLLLESDVVTILNELLVKVEVLLGIYDRLKVCFKS